MSNVFKKWMIGFSFTWIYVVLILVYPTQESVILPGNVQNTSRIFTIDGLTTSSMQTIYVINYEPLTYFQRTILSYDEAATIAPISAYEASLSQLDMYKVGQIQKESAYHLSVITAYKKASQSIDYQFKGYSLISKPNRDIDLEIGDLIISINGLPLTETTSLVEFFRDDILVIDLIRNEQVLTITYERNIEDIPLYVYPMFQLNIVSPPIDLKGLDSFIGGPSSGMMMTLSIYATLMEYTFDVTIAGTGTIEMDGRIGRIGGLYQKYVTVYDHVDYLIIPFDQLSILEQVDTQKVIPVKTIDEAIAFLETIK